MFKHYVCNVKLEKAIKQTKPFKSKHSKLMVNLVYSYMWVRDNQKAYFKPFDITMQQYNILRILRGADEAISTAIIKERMLDRASDASRIVDRLEKKGLVQKSTCETDQRKVDVSLSEAGMKILRKIDKSIDDWQSGLVNLTEKEADQLSSLLDKMRS